MKHLLAGFVVVLWTLSFAIKAEEFLDLGSLEIGKYSEVADDLLCSDKNADSCRSPVDKTKLKQRQVAFEHWARGYVSAVLRQWPLTEGQQLPLKILAQLPSEVRKKLMSEFFLRLQISGRLSPRKLFGEAVADTGIWLGNEILKKSCSLILKKDEATP